MASPRKWLLPRMAFPQKWVLPKNDFSPKDGVSPENGFLQKNFACNLLKSFPVCINFFNFSEISFKTNSNGLFTSYTRLPQTCLFMKHQNMIPSNILHVQIFLTNIAQVTIS